MGRGITKQDAKGEHFYGSKRREQRGENRESPFDNLFDKLRVTSSGQGREWTQRGRDLGQLKGQNSKGKIGEGINKQDAKAQRRKGGAFLQKQTKGHGGDSPLPA